MRMKEIKVAQEDGYQTVLYPYFTEQEEIHGTVVVLHGVAEHHARYLEFTEYLNSRGYDVFLYDHRGHGTDKMIEELGFISEKNGYARLIGDALRVLAVARKNKRGGQLVLFGHSMGSLVARNVIQYDDDIDCVVVCGTSAQPPAVLTAGQLLTSYLRLVKGPRTLSPFLNKQLFGRGNYKKLCERTAVDWLTRDHSEVGQYIYDPFCGFVCTTSLYCDLIKLAQYSMNVACIKRTRRDLPILLTSGAADPVGNMGQDVSRLYARLQALGFEHVDCVLYAECRHELLNEINHAEISKDIVDWIERQSAICENKAERE